jgi:hypothetical protein
MALQELTPPYTMGRGTSSLRIRRPCAGAARSRRFPAVQGNGPGRIDLPMGRLVDAPGAPGSPAPLTALPPSFLGNSADKSPPERYDTPRRPLAGAAQEREWRNWQTHWI